MISFLRVEMQIFIIESFFNNSISEKNGGAIYIYFSKTIVIEKCIFKYGKATLGGAIYYEENQGL